MTAVLAALAASLGRVLQRPTAALSVLVLVALLAACGTLVATTAIYEPLAWRVDPAWSPRGLDVALLDDLPWERFAWSDTVSGAWGLLGLLAMVAFAWSDSVLMRAAAGPWPGLRSAWARALAQSPALISIAITALVWVGLVSFATHGFLGSQVERAASRASSERLAIAYGLVPDLFWLLLVAPMVLAADLARARVVALERRSGLLALLWSADRVVRSIRPWIAAGTAFLTDMVLMTAAAMLRSMWDPRTAPAAFIALGAILVLLFGRILIHGAYLGGLARLVRGLAAAAPEPTMTGRTPVGRSSRAARDAWPAGTSVRDVR
ncbi:MAG: hypothetical protein JSV80_16160 [Acidobacteriota bacterium]|nr:MAG: hypothetical protein JSV80_16160 [Acidobacteriota bacterium]